jgi:RecB family exonuclease
MSQGHEPPFKSRPGLVAAMLELYDELRRQPQILDRFEDLLVSELESTVAVDRGADRLLRQTRFLVASFRAYEARAREAGWLDEHALRGLLMAAEAPDPLRHIVVTVGDRVSGADGLWPADFDLLTRLPRLETIDIIATESELHAGFQERVHDLLPGLDEVSGADGASGEGLVLAAPGDAENGARFFTARDREEELTGIARRLKSAARREAPELPAVDLDRSAVVYARPLPYLYLAQSVFDAAGVPFQASDALPLAAEPYAATLDLVLSAVSSSFSENAILALVTSPHLDLGVDGVNGGNGGNGVIREQLSPLLSAAPASAQVSVLLEFLERHDRPPAMDDPLRDRHERARTAITAGLAMLRDAHRRFADPVVTMDDIAATLRRWIEDQMFSPRLGTEGLHLMDARAARYGDFEAVHLVGLVDGEWPSLPPGNVFYSAGLLRKLGWPADRDRMAAARAQFDDLVRLPGRLLTVSSFALERDSIVEPSPLVEALDALPLDVVRVGASRARIFRHEALAEPPLASSVLADEPASWARLRTSRPPADAPRYRGFTEPVVAARYAVSGLERHLDCPFKYFAERVLALEPDEDEEGVMTPLERGAFVHDVFRAFFEAWQRQGGGTITPDRIDDALELFGGVLEPFVASLPASEALVERTRLVGSPVQPGMAETVFRVEAAQTARVVERRLEYRLEGTFEFSANDEARAVALSGVADRIDLLEDGSLRLIDYKTGTPPRPGRALQLPIYSLCAERQLAGTTGTRWTIGDALYIAFKGRAVTPLFSRVADRDKALKAAQERLIQVVGAIERGEFPVQPDQPFLCSYCAYSSVCRKDYVDL